MQRRYSSTRLVMSLSLILTLGSALPGQTSNIESGRRYDRLIIRNVMMVDGNGTPAQGPVDIVIEGSSIQSVRGARRGENPYPHEAHVIDGSGMYALPGLINLHAHIHDTRGRRAIPFDYLYKLWLSCGITTVRDVGSNTQKTLKERDKSRAGEIVAPRIFLYMRAGGRTPAEARQAVRRIKEAGGDGVKIFGMDRDIMEAAVSEARALGLRVAHHVGVEETDARHDAAFGVTSIEHWYGVPDAALRGSQNFPYWYNYNDESDRFRYAGRLWREADPEKLKKVLKDMVAHQVSWCPTFVIYEANRGLLRAQNQPWFDDYLHPVLEERRQEVDHHVRLLDQGLAQLLVVHVEFHGIALWVVPQAAPGQLDVAVADPDEPALFRRLFQHVGDEVGRALAGAEDEYVFHGIKDTIRRLSTPTECTKGTAHFSLETGLFGQKEHSFHALHHLTMIGGRAKNISIVSFKVCFFFDGSDIFNCCLCTCEANPFCNQFSNTLCFTGPCCKHY